MKEKFESWGGNKPEREESLEQKIERLRPVFQRSFDVFQNPEKRLEEGALTITRRLPDGKMETLPLLVVVEINEDGPNLAGIDENGEPTSSATMPWSEIIDVR